QNTPSIGYSMTVHRRRECSAGLWFAFLIEAGPHAVNYPLSLHDALPICGQVGQLEEYLGVTLFQRRPFALTPPGEKLYKFIQPRSEEHTSELQSPCNLVCRLLLVKKKLSPKPVHAHSTMAATRSLAPRLA